MNNYFKKMSIIMGIISTFNYYSSANSVSKNNNTVSKISNANKPEINKKLSSGNKMPVNVNDKNPKSNNDLKLTIDKNVTKDDKKNPQNVPLTSNTTDFIKNSKNIENLKNFFLKMKDNNICCLSFGFSMAILLDVLYNFFKDNKSDGLLNQGLPKKDLVKSGIIEDVFVPSYFDENKYIFDNFYGKLNKVKFDSSFDHSFIEENKNHLKLVDNGYIQNYKYLSIVKKLINDRILYVCDGNDFKLPNENVYLVPSRKDNAGAVYNTNGYFNITVPKNTAYKENSMCLKCNDNNGYLKVFFDNGNVNSSYYLITINDFFESVVKKEENNFTNYNKVIVVVNEWSQFIYPFSNFLKGNEENVADVLNDFKDKEIFLVKSKIPNEKSFDVLLRGAKPKET